MAVMLLSIHRHKFFGPDILGRIVSLLDAPFFRGLRFQLLPAHIQ
jgi:hypothetical protein